MIELEPQEDNVDYPPRLGTPATDDATDWHAPSPGAVHARLPRVDLCGTPIDALEVDEAVQWLGRAIDQNARMQVCTVNLDFLVSARQDKEVRSILEQAELNLADGAPLLWLSRAAGQPLPGRAAGADLIPRLMLAAAQQGWRIFLLGGENGVGAVAAAELVRQYPTLAIAGVYEPPRSALEDMNDDEILRQLAAANADILLVALGHPKQEKWIHRHRDGLQVQVSIGVGCTLDLLAGRHTRAPLWMRTRGLEWLYRLGNEPRRLSRRYVKDGLVFAVFLLPHSISQRRQRRNAASDAGDGGVNRVSPRS